MNLLRLLWGSLVYRPYVYAFLACFVVFAVRHLGAWRALWFFVPTYLVAYASEYSATRNGFPFGHYRYFDETRTRELWLSNVPFFDSLSFVFLSYFSFVLAAALLGDVSRPASRVIPWLGGLLMVLLDVVIDPVALQGEKWFLGRLYDYPYRGFYFGVTAANFAGWFFVGVLSQALFRALLRAFSGSRSAPERGGPVSAGFVALAYGVYSAVLVFNLIITFAIGDYRLGVASAAVSATTLGAIALGLRWRRAALGSRNAPSAPRGPAEHAQGPRGSAHALGVHRHQTRAPSPCLRRDPLPPAYREPRRPLLVGRRARSGRGANACASDSTAANALRARILSTGFAGALDAGLPLGTWICAQALSEWKQGALVPLTGHAPAPLQLDEFPWLPGDVVSTDHLVGPDSALRGASARTARIARSSPRAPRAARLVPRTWNPRRSRARHASAASPFQSCA